MHPLHCRMDAEAIADILAVLREQLVAKYAVEEAAPDVDGCVGMLSEFHYDLSTRTHSLTCGFCTGQKS